MLCSAFTRSITLFFFSFSVTFLLRISTERACSGDSLPTSYNAAGWNSEESRRHWTRFVWNDETSIMQLRIIVFDLCYVRFWINVPIFESKISYIHTLTALAAGYRKIFSLTWESKFNWENRIVQNSNQFVRIILPRDRRYRKFR